MEEKENLQEVNNVGCDDAVDNPWPPGTSYYTTALAGLPVFLGAYALLKKAPYRLPILVSMWVALATVVRQVVCCRCEYYGQDCCTMMGKWTASRYERDTENTLTAEAFQLDFGLVGASMLYPLPQVVKMGKPYLAMYIMAVAAAGVGMRQMACKYCPNDVCLMNPGH